MSDLKIYSVSDEYIDFLFDDPKLTRFIFDNKKNTRKHTRKYLGAVFEINGLSYFAPFSSPKPTDYITKPDGSEIIRKSTPTIIRMTSLDNKTGRIELKGTIKISNMIPVPLRELTYYDISAEKDAAYRSLLEKEYAYIKAHKNEILKSVKIVYSQQSRKEQLLAKDPNTLSVKEQQILREFPNYLILPFRFHMPNSSA